MEDSSQSEPKILKAAEVGDVAELEKLLSEKKPGLTQPPYLYPDDWKYTFSDLLVKVREGKTALHHAASVGNHESALECVKLILKSIQVLCPDNEHGGHEEKNRLLINMVDTNSETPLHLAIENKAENVVAYLLCHQANTRAKNKKGIEAMDLVYQQVPDAMTQLYDQSIFLSKDHKSVSINWGPIIRIRQKKKIDPHNPLGTAEPRDHSKVYLELKSSEEDPGAASTVVVNNETITTLFSKETECLSYILNADKYGANLLLHPLVKLFLEEKWKRVQYYFWIPFVLQIFWLLLYAGVYIDLHFQIASLEKVNVTLPVSDNETQIYSYKPIKEIYFNPLWYFLLVLTVIAGGKEAYQAWILQKAYLTIENITEILFILLFVAQFCVLLIGGPSPNAEVIASISVVAIILGTILVIFQLGKTPQFGPQVAAFKKVVASCAPHLLIFSIWFLGFGLAFWALFYDAEKSWVVRMLGIMVAMGTGELNAQDHLEKEEGKALVLTELVRVTVLLLFVIIIVTLYFNLLIGYAVSEIEILKRKAETLQLSNLLSTMFTIESFLLSRIGRLVVVMKCRLEQLICLGCSDGSGEGPMNSIYVLAPSDFNSVKLTRREFRFEDLPARLRKALKEIAFKNYIRRKEEEAVDEQRLNQWLYGSPHGAGPGTEPIHG